MTDADHPALSVGVLSYPYYPSKDTGRGHDRYVWELIENLRRTGAVVRSIEQGFSKGALAAGGKLVRLAADLRSQHADVWHGISPTGAAIAVLLGKRPVVVTVHDLIPFQVSGFDSSAKARLVRAATRLCVKKCAAVIVPYRVTKDELVAKHGADPSRIHVVSYGVDHGTYHPRPELARVDNRILYIGEVSCGKGVDVLIRAFAQVKKRVPGAELLIGGKSSKDQPMLEELARSLGASDITFKGFVPEDELASYYATTTMMVFPSRYGFGLSTLEAMACGTPVVAVAALDTPDFAAGMDILVPPDDPDALAARMLRIFTEPGLRAELVQAGLDKAARYSWENVGRETRKVYETLVAR
ncbi:MAG TPA: glycosyltransferase family 1 protein [Polyangiaceae bacterium]|nr:glycosyltransferase family 1 protein [Polyangiaceae bacterium]